MKALHSPILLRRFEISFKYVNGQHPFSGNGESVLGFYDMYILHHPGNPLKLLTVSLPVYIEFTRKASLLLAQATQ